MEVSDACLTTLLDLAGVNLLGSLSLSLSLENVDPVARAGVGVLFRVGSRSHISAAHRGSWSFETTASDALAVGEVDSVWGVSRDIMPGHIDEGTESSGVGGLTTRV